jgi:hypothetical protein
MIFSINKQYFVSKTLTFLKIITLALVPAGLGSLRGALQSLDDIVVGRSHSSVVLGKLDGLVLSGRR